jgi:hypothetical protein
VFKKEKRVRRHEENKEKLQNLVGLKGINCEKEIARRKTME